MAIEAWLIRLGAGLVIGFCIGLTGIGGGVVVMSTLTLILGLPTSMAVGTACLYNFLTKLFGTFEHFRLKTVDIPLSRWLLVGAIPANVTVAWIVSRTARRLQRGSESLERFQHDLGTVVAVVVLSSVVMLILNFMRHGRRPSDVLRTEFSLTLRDRPLLRRVLGVATGAVIGGLIGATAIGGGVVLMPALIMVFGLSSRRTVGTSIFVSMVLTLSTAGIYGLGGQMDVQTAVLMAAGSWVGVHWGSRLCVKLPERALRLTVIVIVSIAAICMLLK